jgi:hypothetical protein
MKKKCRTPFSCCSIDIIIFPLKSLNLSFFFNKKEEKEEEESSQFKKSMMYFLFTV